MFWLQAKYVPTPYRTDLSSAHNPQTSRHIRDLTFYKEIWAALLSHLHTRGFIDLLPGQHLEEFDVEGLINLAKRIVQGPQSWSAASPAALTPTRQIILTPIGPSYLYWENEVQLLPGGQYLLIQKSKNLECWSMVTRKPVWKYQGQWMSYWVSGFAAALVNDGRAVNILVGVRSLEGDREKCVIFPL